MDVEVVGTLAWTKLAQTFTNRATFPIKEATYRFPLYDKSTVTSFICSIGSEKVLKGVVKSKSQAKAEFKEAVARQRVAALLEEHTPEVFETSIGNLPAQSTIKIEVCYITELKADLSGDGILVTIPTSVAPRYGAPPSSLSSSAVSNSLAVPPENGLQIEIRVSSPVEIETIESRTHPPTIKIGSHGYTTTKNIRDLAKSQKSPDYDPKKARATLSDRNACLGKDFVLLIQCRGRALLASRALLESHPKFPDRSALMVSVNLQDMYTPNVVAPRSQSEIIFLADRSGSMKDKMEALKTAMTFFLKSLPPNCSFNICSFGFNHILMWPESRLYNQENLDAAMLYIATNFSANMGGTQLLSGLRNVVQKRKPNFNTQIIILTDGEVWDTANTFEFIRSARSAGENGETRFFALGIGDAVSHQLVEGIGRLGGGFAEVVSVDSATDWRGRVVRMLEAALTPSTWEISITLDDFPVAVNEQEPICIQAPQSISNSHAFSRSSVYFLLSQELKSDTVKIKATATSGETVTAELPIQRLENQRTGIHQLAAKAVLTDLESGHSWLHEISRNRHGKSNAQIEDLAKAEGEKLGIEWSLSSKWTSFVVVDNSSFLEKPSRLYRAEKTDLAELTRTRYDVANLSSYGGSITPDRSGYRIPQSLGPLTSTSSSSVSGRVPLTIFAPDSFPSRQRSQPPPAPPDYPNFSFGPMENDHSSQFFTPSGAYSPNMETVTAFSPISEAPQQSDSLSTLSSESFGAGAGISAGASNIPRAPIAAEDRLQLRRGHATSHKGSIQGGHPTLSTDSIGSPYSSGADTYTSSFRLNPHGGMGGGKNRPSYSPLPLGPDPMAARKESKQDPLQTFRDRYGMPPPQHDPSFWSASSSSRNESPDGGSVSESERLLMTIEITLEELIDAQTVEGRFKFEGNLATALKTKFRHWRFDLLVSELGIYHRDISLYMSMHKVLDTARAIVLVEERYAESRELWRLVIQKAKGFVTTVIPDYEQREKLFGILRNQLFGSQGAIDNAFRQRESYYRGNLLRILRILDDPGELLRLFRRHIPPDPERLICVLGDEKLQNGQIGKVGANKRGNDPKSWTDGWDDILKVPEAIWLVIQEGGPSGWW